MRKAGAMRGFTLIELLVVIAILAVVATAIGACLAAGIRAWDAARDFSSVETDALIDLEIMQRDIMNTFRYHDIKFLGSKVLVSFPCLVRARDPDDAGLGDEPERAGTKHIGTVRYSYNKEKLSLFRKTWRYPGSQADVEDPGSVVIGNLAGVTFEYYRLSPEPGQPGTWVGSWTEETNLPARVRIGLTFAGDARPAGITRTIIIPTAKREVPEK